ncbi:hypothetical protein DTL42_19400 [Bremerella cremea]|uniref:Uncharacterized protein n=2 Tax=Bremerella cremea TaxID=1031537 RepID=A0A368KPF5_9BACT|nr:hypothetical protein DTL42_19400 [Bremerella cremea]
MSCRTQEEIAEAVGVTQQGVDKILKSLQRNEDLRFVVEPGQHSEIENDEKRLNTIAEENQALANHQTDSSRNFILRYKTRDCHRLTGEWFLTG